MSKIAEPTTNTERKVIVIPATKSLHPERDGVTPVRKKKRVAAYCRVSTALEEQQGSYDLQQTYYEKMIKDNPNWEFAGIYGDEGKSGTSLKGRTGFLEMMDDVRAGKIDCIIAKATSRFGRNTIDFNTVMIELESYGVEVLFESEGILTSGKHDRMMLQILGVVNEHYSSTLSDNIRWSKERNMRSGKVTICYKTFLGYKKGADGNPEIVEEEAETVRLIYKLFLEGKSYTFIAKHLNELCIPTPAGKTEWHGNIVKSILVNEKYTGDVLLQKTYTANYLDKKSRKNNGERPQVLVENNHPAIIDKPTFARAQELVKARKDKRNSGTAKDPFVGRVICNDCGGIYGHKTWNSRGRIKYKMWICNNKYTDDTAYADNKCKSANLRQEWLEQGYLYTINQLLPRRSQIMGRYGRKLARIEARLQSGDIDKEIQRLTAESQELDKQTEQLNVEWEFTFGDHTDFNRKMDDLEAKKQAIVQNVHALEEEQEQLNATKKTMQTFLDTFEKMPDHISRFDGNDFINTIDRVIAEQDTLTYYFYGGESAKVKIEALKKMWY